MLLDFLMAIFLYNTSNNNHWTNIGGKEYTRKK